MNFYTVPIFLSLLCCLSCALFMSLRGRSSHGLSLLFKILMSLSFAAVGGYFYFPSRLGLFVLIGLSLGALGDLLLGLRKLFPHHHDLTFILGAVSFSLGHGFYMGFLSSQSTGLWDPALPVFLGVMVLSFFYSRIGGFSGKKLYLPGMAYIGIEALMCSLAAVLFWKCPGMGSFLFFLGGISFLVSDNLLCAYTFGTRKTFSVDVLLHVTYVAAQLLIAWSLGWF